MTRSLSQHLDPNEGPKRILALDGGGVKGILTLGMLQAIEAELRRRSGNPRLVLSDYYDLIGGTSTGAIIASGLALGKSVEDMIRLYQDLGPQVFGKSRARGVLRVQFDSKKLRKALAGVLTTKTLGTDQLRTGFAACAKRIDTGSAWVLSNHPKAKYFDPPSDAGTVPNKKYKLIDIVQASAAAPTFFNEVKIDIAYGDDADAETDKPKIAEEGYFLDGAVGANNNPSMQLLMLALVREYGFKWEAGAESLMMTSVGTGLRRPKIAGKNFRDQPSAGKAIHALRAMIYDTQIQGVMMLQAMSDPVRPWIVNSEIGDMGESLFGDKIMLDYQRMDVRLEEPRPGPDRPRMVYAEDMIRQTLTEKQLLDLDALANGNHDNMDLLLQIGEATGKAYVDEMYPNPKFDLPEWRR